MIHLSRPSLHLLILHPHSSCFQPYSHHMSYVSTFLIMFHIYVLVPCFDSLSPILIPCSSFQPSIFHLNFSSSILIFYLPFRPSISYLDFLSLVHVSILHSNLPLLECKWWQISNIFDCVLTDNIWIHKTKWNGKTYIYTYIHYI